MNIVIVECPPRPRPSTSIWARLQGARLLRPRARPARPRTARSSPTRTSPWIGRSMPKAAKRLNEIAEAVKGADRLILATDPDREGEAISWHVLEVLDGKKALEGHAGRARGVQRHHQAGRAGGHAPSARRSTWSWSMPISPAARWIIWSASPCRRCCGASCRAPARPAGCSRWRCGSSCDREARDRAVQGPGILDHRGRARHRQERSLPGPPRRRRRQEARKVRHPQRGRRPNA